MQGHMLWMGDIAVETPKRNAALRSIRCPWWKRAWLALRRWLWRPRISLDYEVKTDLLPREQYFLRGHLLRQRLLRRSDG